jgi:hypothetical protein
LTIEDRLTIEVADDRLTNEVADRLIPTTPTSG